MSLKQRGSIYVESVMVIPFLFLLLLGVVETGRFIILNQKLERATGDLANLLSQELELKASRVNEYISPSILSMMIAPYNVSNGSYIVVSSVSKDASGTKVRWKVPDCQAPDCSSDVGAVGDDAQIDGLSLEDGEGLIVVETRYAFQPDFGFKMMPTMTIQKESFFRSRYADLSILQPE